ncbi:SIMPL domain-containing protein [Plantactinospora sp. GCM10030261]|uniref:SIMPL domain-containing protein n=1 Tax=Plantactinospora sp. GCM10030261 TaxID=3273420 RepID=UPI00361E2390
MVDTPVVRVRGEIEREVPPEVARFAVTVAARDRDRETTLRRLAERSAALRSLLDQYREAIERHETGQVWIRPELKRSGERVAAYHGSVGTTVTVTDFAALGEMMLRLADQDQTTVAGPWWSLRPDSPVYGEARRDAVRAAIDRAGEYADALGARVISLVELADTDLAADRPMLMRTAGFAGGAEAGGPPALDLDPQQQTVRASIEATFTISAPALPGTSAE